MPGRLVFILWAMALHCSAQPGPRVVPGIPDWEQVVGVLYTDSLGKDSLGTGFVIARRNLVMTCAHEVGTRHRLYFGTVKDDFPRPVSLKALDSCADLALLESEDSITSVPPLELAHSFRLSYGDSIYYICYNPGTHSCHLHCTKIYDQGKGDRVEGIDRCIQYFGEIIPGNSGGPVLNFNGEVIGIIKGRIRSISSFPGMLSEKGCAFPVFSFEEYLH